MHVAITFLLTFTFILMSFFTIGRQLLFAYDDIMLGWRALQHRTFQKGDTRLSAPLGQTAVEGTSVSLTLVNEGKVALQDFTNWSVVFEVKTATGMDFLELAYTTEASPGAEEWTVSGIYLDAENETAEVADPGVFNPGEEMVALATLSQPLIANTYARATFAAPNGSTVKIIFKVLASLYVLDETDALVYRYSENGTLQDTKALSAANGSAMGITTDGSGFWTTDWVDDHVYEYDSDFVLLGNWDQTVLNKHAVGITTNGSNIWTVDEVGLKVFKYDMNGNLAVDVPNFALNLENSAPTGITTDGSSIWVVDGNGKVFEYDMTGVSLSSFQLAAENAGPTGITTDGTYFWVVDATALKVFKYTLSGVERGSFALDAANADPEGITVRTRSFN